MGRLPVVAMMLAGCRIYFDPLADGAGSSDPTTRVAQVSLGVSLTCARSNHGQVTCWGNNNYGKLGIGSSDTSGRGDRPGELPLPPIDLGAARTAQTIHAGLDFACALLDDDRVKCWGNNDGGQLGDGDKLSRGSAPAQMGDALPAVGVANGGPFEAMTSGHYHTCVLRAGSTWCFGINDTSQDGAGDANAHITDLATLPPVALGAFSAVEVSAGFNNTCARDAGGAVKCWGDNTSGALGIGDTNARGDQAAAMGDALPLVQLPSPAQQLAVGFGHACALTAAGVFCWGQNAHGELGVGDQQSRGDMTGEIGTLMPLPLPPVAQLASGREFSCALLVSGEVACWGRNTNGQLGLGDTRDRGINPGEIDATLRVPLDEKATSVACGQDHACAVLASGALACWGSNESGQLGAGDNAARGDDAGEKPFEIAGSSLW